MLFALFRNVAITAIAFFFTGLIGLLLVPILVHAYSLAGFGLIIMARMFLPLAVLAAVDFGVGEYVTQSVAKARVAADRSSCGRELCMALGVAVVLGLLSGAALFVASFWMSAWLSVPAEHQAAFARVMQFTAVSMPVFFSSLVFEGVVKGQENYAMQRAIEVLASIIYSGLAIAAVWLGWQFDAVCYALLLSLWVRALVALFVAARSLRSWKLQFAYPTSAERDAFRMRARLMVSNKCMGVAQAQSSPLLISVLLGPASLGVFDALTRLPRFAKTVLGLLSSTVLPVAARLESDADDKGLTRLGQSGALTAGLVALPPIAAAVVFSKPLLQVWLGDAFAHLWLWQALMFIVPALGVLVGFGGAALIVRPAALAAMNRLVLLQIALQFAIALAGLSVLQEKAFIVGQVVATSITFFWQMRLIATELKTAEHAGKRLMRIGVVAVALVLPGWGLQGWIMGPLSLGLAMAAWTAACWVGCYFLVLSAVQRQRLQAFVGRKWASRKPI